MPSPKRGKDPLSKPPYISAADWKAARGNPRKRAALLKESGRRQRERIEKLGKKKPLRENFLRLAHRMMENNIPKDRAYDFARRQQTMQDDYIPNYSLTVTGVLNDEKWAEFEDRYANWYDELYTEFGFDINESYPREE